MPQTPLNIPLGAQFGASITTDTTTLINAGSAATLAGYVVTNAGASWTVQFYNGNPTSGGVALTPVLPIAAIGVFSTVLLRAAQGLYAVTAGTTAGALQVAYYG